jgi:hypothetical protein
VPKDWVIVSRYACLPCNRYLKFTTLQYQERTEVLHAHCETQGARARAAHGDPHGRGRAHVPHLPGRARAGALRGVPGRDPQARDRGLPPQPGYAKPEFTDEEVFAVVGGRHPMLEALRADPFVPNDARLGASAPRSKVITGPNMGGKSSCVRMLALCAIMAQVGAYVPADSLRMSMLDGVHTRMGGEQFPWRARQCC